MKYIWTIIWNLVSVIFSLVLLSAFNSNFEGVAIAILVILWSGINQGFAAIELSNSQKFIAMYKKMIKIHYKNDTTTFRNKNSDEDELDLGDDDPDLDDSEEEIENTEIKDIEAKLHVSTVKLYIAIAGNALIWIVAILKIIGSLNSQ